MTATERPTTTAPPPDPVTAALADPSVRAKLLAHAHTCLRGAPAVDAEEVVSRVTAKVLENRAAFDPTRGGVTAWIHGFVPNVAREAIRAAYKLPSQPSPDGLPLDELAVARPDVESDPAELRFRVEKCLNQLPAEFRAAVSMRYLEDAEFAEIAARLGTTAVNARMKVSRGIRRLRELAGVTPKEERS